MTLSAYRSITCILPKMLRLFLFTFSLSFISLPLHAQLEYTSKVSAEIKDSSRLHGVILLTTKDFHQRYGAANHLPSSLQIVDPLEPWPPIFIATINPKYKESESYVYQDFRFQEATRQLTLLEGAHPADNFAARYFICDTNFQILDTIGNKAYRIDGHTFQINSKGERLYFSSRDTVLDISAYSGSRKDTAVNVSMELIEIADRTGKIIWRWNPIGYLPISDTYQVLHNPSAFKPGTRNWDWGHGNSLSFASDGNILYSYRVLGVGKINRESGEIMWKLGGKSPDIKVPKGGEYYQQHDFCEIAPGLYSLFSNGDDDHPDSKAIVYNIDEKKLTATVSRIVQPATPVFSLSMGSFTTNKSGLSVLTYGRYSSLAKQQPVFEIVDEQNKVQAIYSTPNLSFPYRVELVESWKLPNRPVITNEKGVLKASGFNSFVKWFEVKDGNVFFLSEQFNFVPTHSGTYITIIPAGFGWLVSKPYEFVK